jgi:hypothetical protein
MKMRLELALKLECTVCGRGLGEADADELAEIRIFGYAAYAVCPSCQQKPPDQHDKLYRKRVRAWVAQKKKEEADRRFAR